MAFVVPYLPKEILSINLLLKKICIRYASMNMKSLHFKLNVFTFLATVYENNESKLATWKFLLINK